MIYKQLSSCHFLSSKISSVAPQDPWPCRGKDFHDLQGSCGLHCLTSPASVLETSRMLVGIVVFTFLSLDYQGHWEFLGPGILCHPSSTRESAWHTVSVWLLIANHLCIRNIVQLCFFCICLYCLAPSNWKWIMIWHVNQEEEKNTYPSSLLSLSLSFLFVCC